MEKFIKCYLDDSALTALATALLVVVGLVQLVILFAQKRQTQIALIAEYRRLWSNCRQHFGVVIFIARNPEEYYQILNHDELNELSKKRNKYSLSEPTTWALESIQNVFNLMDELTIRILQGQLNVSDVYPIFGTGFLRHSRPLRILLDTAYPDTWHSTSEHKEHNSIRREMQSWLTYHNGVRRRCLILIDILWAEAVRLEDLPPYDIISAADAKKKTGKLNRRRVFTETLRLNGIRKIFMAIKISNFLKRAQYRTFWNFKGFEKSRITSLDKDWTDRLLRR